MQGLLVALLIIPLFWKHGLAGNAHNIWTGCFLLLSSALFILGLTYIFKRTNRLVGMLSLSLLISTFIIYPFIVRVYTEHVNKGRKDFMRWEGSGGIYYFTDTRYTAFSAIIQLFPPYFSLPKNYDAEQSVPEYPPQGVGSSKP